MIKREKKITIDQVARLCGVSKTTISRFLNGKFDSISEATRERIAEVIQEVGYQPDRSAQRLKSSRSMLIGCVVGDVSSPFSGYLLKGMTGVCEASGYQVLFADTRDDPERERSAIEGFIANRVDGLVVNTTGENDELLIEVQNRGIPVALADRRIAVDNVIDTVCSSDVASAYECVRFLRGQGYAHIAFFTEGSSRVSPRRLRMKGYETGIRELMPTEEPIIFTFLRDDEGSCRECVESFLKRYPGERIAIISVNGVAAHHILLAMNEMGIIPGYDLGLLTYDDWSWLRLAPPGITTVAMSSEQIGAEAAKMIISRASGERPLNAPAEYMEIATKLKVRASTPAKR